MKNPVTSLLLVIMLPLAAHLAHAAAASPIVAQAYPGERLGKVSFSVSCAPSVRASFNRGVALLHDFWYEEARPQFEQTLKIDPGCAMAHWGIAMSVFHQIWDRPDEAVSTRAANELEAARLRPAKTARERAYVAALSGLFQSGKDAYQTRIDRYADAMGELYRRYPQDTDAGAFYALSLLAAEAPGDTSLTAAHKAMAVLNSLFAENPEHPGVVHYIIHACDTPSLARQGLNAAQRYGEIASSGPHAVHMPGHIFARLGMWQADIDANAASVAASHAAEARQQNGAMDQFHSNDFLAYAYLQSGQDALARAVVADSAAALTRFEAMPAMGEHYMTGMFPYYRTKLPIFLALEMRDWKSAAALEPVAGAPPESQTLTYWARTLAAARLHQPLQARANLREYDSLLEQVKRGRHAYFAESTGTRIERGEMLAWATFAEGNSEDALKLMRESADLQDKVGQAEVDIPAREMLGDMLLELRLPQPALIEYRQALALSPNRFNGLYNAGRAAEAAGDAAGAKKYYAALLESTNNGVQSSRPEIEHVKSFLASRSVAEN